jgi:hypothetical protein
MGRLTLNVLLSFAQFERELTGERIRDKIAASKKKGMWMGGYPPLGYDVKDRKLVVNEVEAETVRYIFRRYQELRSVRQLKEHLDAAGIVSKRRTAPDGRPYGGKPIARGALYHMLQNRIYRGEIVHKDQAYPGEHDPIVDDDLWQGVQTTLATNRVDRGAGKGNRHLSLLAGLIYDAHGEPMTPSHAVKKGVRYRYYVSKSLLTGRDDMATKRGQRIPAAHIEALVADRIRAWLADPVAVLNAVQCHGPDAIAQKRLLDEAARLAASWQDLDAEHLRALLLAVLTKVQVHSDRIDVTLDQMGVALWLNAQDQQQPAHPGGYDLERHPTVLTIRARLKRTGIEMRMVVDSDSEPANVDPVLVRLLVRAHAIRARLLQDPSLTLREIAAEEGVGGSYVSRLVRLAFLAPDIVTAVLSGRHPPQLTANRLMDDTRLPLDWRAQGELLCS